MAGERKIQINITGDASGLKRAAGEAEQATSKFSQRAQKFATAGLAASAAVGVALVAGLKAGVQGLQEGEEAEARFADALSRVPKQVAINSEAFKGYAEAIQQSTRFSYEDALAAGTMLAAQDGVQRAIRNGTTTLEGATQVALDWATATGKDATTAATTYAKAMAAPEKASALLRKAGVNLTVAQQEQIKEFVKAGDVGKAQAIIQDELRAKFEGSAKAAGETTAGQMVRAQNAFGEVQEQLAVGLLPVLTDLLGHLVKVTAWAQENPGKVKAVVIVLASLAAVIGTISAVIKVWTAVTKVAAAVQAAWNAVLLANPIVLITVAIVALIAVIVLIATKTTWFQQIWSKAWGAIKGAVSGVFNWIKGNWPLILAILTGPFGLAVLAITKNFDKIVSFVKGIPGKIKAALGDMLGLLKQAGLDLVQGMINGVTEAAGRLASTIKDKLVDAPKKLLEGATGWLFGSPSKITTKYGKYITEGFIKGIELTGPRLLEAQQKLNDKLRAKVDQAKDIARGIRDAFKIDLAATTFDSETGASGPSIFERLAEQAKAAESFASVIQQLRKMGLRQDLLDNLIASGPSSLASAIELGRDVGAANRLAGRISSAGSSLANSETLARTGINIAAPEVYVSVQLDGKEIKAITKAEIKAQQEKDKKAVKAGSKRVA